jgi:hypothetical protein
MEQGTYRSLACGLMHFKLCHVPNGLEHPLAITTDKIERKDGSLSFRGILGSLGRSWKQLGWANPLVLSSLLSHASCCNDSASLEGSAGCHVLFLLPKCPTV